MPARPASSSLPTVPPLVLCAIGWLIPGAAHVWLGRRDKGVIFLVVLVALFAAGLALEGWEVKAIRGGRANIGEAYVMVRGAELFLFGANIAPLPTVSTAA